MKEINNEVYFEYGTKMLEGDRSKLKASLILIRDEISEAMDIVATRIGIGIANGEYSAEYGKGMLEGIKKLYTYIK